MGCSLLFALTKKVSMSYQFWSREFISSVPISIQIHSQRYVLELLCDHKLIRSRSWSCLLSFIYVKSNRAHWWDRGLLKWPLSVYRRSNVAYSWLSYYSKRARSHSTSCAYSGQLSPSSISHSWKIRPNIFIPFRSLLQLSIGIFHT